MIELAYFHKDSVTTCEEIKKDCNKEDYIKEDCDNWKRLWLKKFVLVIR